MSGNRNDLKKILGKVCPLGYNKLAY